MFSLMWDIGRRKGHKSERGNTRDIEGEKRKGRRDTRG
jgi:hypothetical protein